MASAVRREKRAMAVAELLAHQPPEIIDHLLGLIAALRGEGSSSSRDLPPARLGVQRSPLITE